MPPVLLFRPTVKYIELMILWRDALFKVACVDPGLPKSKHSLSMGFVGATLVPVLVFLDNSSNHHLVQQQRVVVASSHSSSSIVGAGSTGAAPTSLYRWSDTSTVAAITKEEIPSSSSEAASTDTASYRVWDLPNGRVEFHNPFIFYGLALRGSISSGQQMMILESDPTTSSVRSETSSIALWDPIFLGR